MGAAVLTHRFPCRPRRDPLHRRFALAACASLLVHLWLAWELPAGRAPGGSRPLEVRLQPAAATSVLQTIAAKTDAPDALHEPDVAAPPVAPAGTRAHERPAREEGDPRQTTEGVVPPRPVDVTYYSARQLDHYPALLAPLAIRYPERAFAEGRAGRALVMVTMDAAGRVADASVVEAEPAGFFEDAAREALKAAAFSPGRRNGLPVGSRLLIRIEFDPNGTVTAAP